MWSLESRTSGPKGKRNPWCSATVDRYCVSRTTSNGYKVRRASDRIQGHDAIGHGHEVLTVPRLRALFLRALKA